MFLCRRTTERKMEGGMVAVVQGLQDAGLAVTLLSQQPPGRSVLSRLVGVTSPSQVSQSMVDSATGTAIKDYSSKSLYRTTYQMAHCQPSETFRYKQQPFQGYQQYRSSTSRTPNEEAFVESLRKYPMSPVRSRSADLIERMLSYTQSKNGARYTNTRSAKSLPSKEAIKHLPTDEIPTKDTGITTCDLRPNYGFKRDAELIPIPTSNRKSRCDNQIGMYDYLKSNYKENKLKGSEVRYLTNVKQCLRERLLQICDEDPTPICPKIQNRYSQHRRQYHRADASHKTQKLNYCKKMEKCPDCKENTTQAFSNNGIQILPNTPREHKVDGSLSSFKNSKACYCDRPGPCDCVTKPSRSILKAKLHPDTPESVFNKRKQCISICQHQCNKTEEELRETVLNWLQELPVYANFSTADAIKREEIINKLIDTLGQFQKDNTYFEKTENEIKNCLKLLPMWRPDNKVDQESFNNKLANNLLRKIKSLVNIKDEFRDEISIWVDSIPFTCNTIDKEKIIDELTNKLKPIDLKHSKDKDFKKLLKTEIVKTLNELPLELNESKTIVINNMADKLVEKLDSLPHEQPLLPEQQDIKNLVLDWVKNILQIFNDIDLNSDDYVLVNDLITRLNNLLTENSDNRRAEMNDEITKWLSSVEGNKNYQIDTNLKNTLISQLVDKVFDFYERHRLKENLNQIVQKWFGDITDMLAIKFMDNEKDLEVLVTTLRDLQSIIDEENRQNSMRQEILTWLQNLQRKRGRYVDSGIQENVINKLISMIRDIFKIQENAENVLITQKIWEWLESQPEFKQDNYFHYRDMVTELSGKLQDIKDKKGEFIENDIKAEVTKWFEKLFQVRGIQIQPKNQKILQEKLFSSLSPIKRRKYWEKPNNIHKLVSKEVSNIINDSIIRLQKNDKELLKDQIVKVIIKDLNAIHSQQSDESISKIMSILKQATSLYKTQMYDLALKLLNKIKEIRLSNLLATEPEELGLDYASKSKLKSRVEHILKMLPLKDKGQVINTITDTLVTNYKEGKIDTGFEIIYEVLKKANVSETEAQNTTNKLLDMSNRFRNELTEPTHSSPSYGSTESLWVQKQMFMQRLEQEITDFMEKVLNESSSFYKEKTSNDLITTETLEDSLNHYNIFKNPPLKTSTPIKLDSGQDIKTESKFKNEIKEVIRKWIDNLHIDDYVDESFKNDMANDIATDIIDRQRYTQFSKIKHSSQEEIEHLKYQIFKWTSKSPNLIFATKMSQINILRKSLEVIGISNLNQEPNKQDFTNGKVDGVSSMEYDFNITTQSTDNVIEENIYGAIWDGLNKISILKSKSSEDRRIMDDLIMELSKKLKNILDLSPNTEASNIENLCKDEILNCLRILNRYQNIAEEVLQHTTNELINELKSLEVFSNFLKQSQEMSMEAANRLLKKDAIKKAVQNWCQKLPFKSGKTYDDMKDLIDNLAEAVSRYLLITDMENLNTYMDDILTNLRKLPLQFDEKDSKHLPQFTERLIETLKDVLNDSVKYYSSTLNATAVRKPALKKAIEVMYDAIQNWCDNLPLDSGITKESIEQINMIKQNLVGKLLKKVGELNLDPEIFHDDYLYEAVLKDEIEKILDSLPKTKSLEEILPTLTENLIKVLLEAKEDMKSELAGFAYKKQLRDAISKTLSSIGLSVSEETPFEVLKDNLADAFISLHYIADDEELKRKYKDKIFTEVNKFCDDYLKRNPCTPLNAHNLNQELYNALKQVPVPKDESMRREVEQIRIKDIVNDWFENLPLEETPGQIQENKMISILAKKLHEIENEAELNPDLDIDETMNYEISKWLKKLKLKSLNEGNMKPIAKSLINKLKSTKKSRKFNETTFRKSIDDDDITSKPDGRLHFPPSSLSADDRAHLKRIKDRTSKDPVILKCEDKKNASIGPVPTATAVQTKVKGGPDNNIFQKVSQNASIQTIIQESEPSTPITPQVIVKEYYWDSHESPTAQSSGSILSCIQSPKTHTTESFPQQARLTSRVTKASQTIPLPASKATITQEASIEQVIKTHIQKESVGTSPQSPCLVRVTATEHQNEVGHYNPDDYLQLNQKRKKESKPCQPCQERTSLCGEFDSGPEAGTGNIFQQNTNEISDFQRNRPDFLSAGYTGANKNYVEYQDNNNQTCFRRPIYQTPTKDVECLAKCKYKWRNQQSCSCRTPILSKCTIPPQSPCHNFSRSNKACYVTQKHCPKCWDGFCPHPSYLYFRQD